jgi:LysR family glycine cleavage system transcriptional activator
MAQPLIDHGRLVALSSQRMRADYSHYLVYPARSERHPALATFRAWLLDAAAAYARETSRPKKQAPRPRRTRRRAR